MKPICRLQGAVATKISELIDQSGSWNEVTLLTNLVLIDARAARCIPLGRTIEDLWAWTREKHGNYSIRSAYRMLIEKASQEEEHSQDKSSHSDVKNNWVWKNYGVAECHRRYGCSGGELSMISSLLRLISIIIILNQWTPMPLVELNLKPHTMHCSHAPMLTSENL
jgi:hypothetical protein